MTTAFAPGPKDRTVRTPQGDLVEVPDDWTLVAPGDPALTRRVKAHGEHFLVQERRGRRTYSRGIWAPAATVAAIRKQLEQERSDPAHEQRRQSAARRRERQQDQYRKDFEHAVVQFLNFHPDHADLAQRLAVRVTEHATPVGSGTVARTSRIPIDQRARAAVIAWLRHQTTSYDWMAIPRRRGSRREVRRVLAERSKTLLDRYRRGERPVDNCPLQSVLD